MGMEGREGPDRAIEEKDKRGLEKGIEGTGRQGGQGREEEGKERRRNR